MPTGSISLIEEAGRQVLAACATFRSFVVSLDVPTALNHIYRDDLPPPTDGKSYTVAEHQALRPCAIVSLDRNAGLAFRREADLVWSATGRLTIQLLRSLDTEDLLDGNPTAEAERDFDDLVGPILDELLAKSGGGLAEVAYLDFVGAVVQFGPYSGDPKRIGEMGAWQGVTLVLEFERG